MESHTHFSSTDCFFNQTKKTMNLKKFNVEELPMEESLEIEGGWLPLLIVTYIIVEWACNPTSTANAFKDGFNQGIK